MTWDEFTKQALRTATFADTNSALSNMGLGVAGEAGEVADIIKKHLYQGHGTEKLTEELGDLLWYIAVLMHITGINFDDVLIENVAKLYHRYPDGFDPEKSINREEYRE